MLCPLYSVLLPFFLHVMVHVWPARVSLTATEAQLCECVGVTAGAPLPLELTCYEHGISHTYYITTSGWVVYIPTNTWGYNVTPTLTFQGMRNHPPLTCRARSSTMSTWYYFRQVALLLPVS